MIHVSQAVRLYESLLRWANLLKDPSVVVGAGVWMVKHSSASRPKDQVQELYRQILDSLKARRLWKEDREDGRHQNLHQVLTDDEVWSIVPMIYRIEELAISSPARVRSDFPFRSQMQYQDALRHGYFVPEGVINEGAWFEVKKSSQRGAGRGVFLKEGKTLYKDDCVTTLQYHADVYRGEQVTWNCPVQIGNTFRRAYDYDELQKGHERGVKLGVGSMINSNMGRANVKLMFNNKGLPLRVVVKVNKIYGGSELFASYTVE